MNFLAHLYLSGSDEEILMGNFIGDHVKGNQLNSYPERIKQGVLLHRYIDTFTDSHPVMMQSKDRIRALYRKYTPVITDVYYDHFLAVNWKNYSDESLNEFAARIYHILEMNSASFPNRTQQMLPYMVKYNWLVSYASLDGLQKILEQMSRRTKFENNMGESVRELKLYYSQFEKEFTEFFAELNNAVEKFLRT